MVALSLDDWLSRFGPETRKVYAGQWNVWMNWVRKQPNWSDATEEKLIEFQENANGKGRYIVLDLIQRYVRERGGTRKTMNRPCLYPTKDARLFVCFALFWCPRSPRIPTCCPYFLDSCNF